MLESGSPLTVTYFPAGVNSLLVWPIPPLHGNCGEQPALRHLSRQEALGSQSACPVSNRRALCCEMGMGTGAGQGMRVQLAVRVCAELRPGAVPHLSVPRPWGCLGAVGWVFVSAEQEDIVSWAQGGSSDQKELLGCLG